MTTQMIAILVNNIPEDDLIVLLERAIDEYKAGKKLDCLATPCMFVMTKLKIKDSGFAQTMKDSAMINDLRVIAKRMGHES